MFFSGSFFFTLDDKDEFPRFKMGQTVLNNPSGWVSEMTFGKTTYHEAMKAALDLIRHKDKPGKEKGQKFCVFAHGSCSSYTK